MKYAALSFATPPAVQFVHLLSRPARFHPDKVAIIDTVGSKTFAQVDRESDGLATAFAAAGSLPGDRVALILPNCSNFIISEIGILKAGMVKVPLNIRFHAKEVLFALNDCEPTVLICEAEFAAGIADAMALVPSLKAVFTIGGVPAGCLKYEDALLLPASPYVPFGSDDAMLIRYTGGTTGKPKGIVHTAQSFLNINLDCVRELGFTSADVAIHVGHLSHGMNFMWGALYSVGATQILYESFEPKLILADIGRYRATFIYMVPTMVHKLLKEDDGQSDVSSLRTFLYSSAPMPVSLLREAITRYGNIFLQVYTLSEAPVITTILPADQHIELETLVGSRLGSCGRESATMEIRLLDESGAEVAAGTPGEIAVRSINNMACYWNRPVETAETLIDGWVLTGDIARRDDDGYLYLVDRKKDVIITGALNVYPKEVEDVLHAHPAVAQAAVIGVPDEEWGEIIRAYIVLQPSASVTEEELVQHCRGQMASYKKPREIRFEETLPLTPIGKVSRVTLRELARAEVAAAVASR
jgi:fatty-acyl-CoA synthase/long-chain acyl-CoA synthetase